MTAKQRHKLRVLQDKFLDLPDVKLFIAENGVNKPLLYGYQLNSTACNLSAHLQPDLECSIRFHLRSAAPYPNRMQQIDNQAI